MNQFNNAVAFYHNISPLCYIHRVNIVDMYPPSQTKIIDINVEYIINGSLHKKELRLKDKRKVYARLIDERKNNDKIKGHLVADKAFNETEYARLEGFLSKKVWEDNIKSMNLSLSLVNCVL